MSTDIMLAALALMMPWLFLFIYIFIFGSSNDVD